MAQIKARFPIAIAVADEDRSVPPRYDMQGILIGHGETVARYVPAGEEVEIEQAEAEAIWERHGRWEDREAVRQAQAVLGKASAATHTRYEG